MEYKYLLWDTVSQQQQPQNVSSLTAAIIKNNWYLEMEKWNCSTCSTQGIISYSCKYVISIPQCHKHAITHKNTPSTLLPVISEPLESGQQCPAPQLRTVALRRILRWSQWQQCMFRIPQLGPTWGNPPSYYFSSSTWRNASAASRL